MSKSFLLLNKNSGLQISALAIVKFVFEGKDYLVYSTQENEQNSQIFVSKLILNSEGKYYIDNILPEEKSKLNNIVYNIVILLPTEAQKGSTFDALIANFSDKFSVKLSPGIPEMDIQEYYSNCSIAITNKLLVDAAVKFYDDNLNETQIEPIVPTWTAPTEVIAPVEASNQVNNSVQGNSIPSPAVSLSEPTPTVVPNLNLQSIPEPQSVVPSSSDVGLRDSMNNVVDNNNARLNPQVEKLAVISDPSLGAAGVNIQSNVAELKSAGYANTKYIVIGTVCLVLAIAVVVVAYILIKNM